MDVVKTNIERIGGLVDLRSREGRGTTFVIKIPLTLAIAAALIVEAGGQRFAIPQAGVLELVRVGEGDGPRVKRIKDAPVLRLRDRLLPLVSLKRMLRLEDVPASDDARGFVVVTQVGSQLFGIVVDRVFDTEEIVVKPVAPILRHITMFSGNTILGDGSVIMILDPNGIARGTGLGAGTSIEAGRAQVALPEAGRTGGVTPLLLFRAGDGAPKAVPLAVVARLEDLPVERIEHAGDGLVTQYRGRLMPLVALPAATPAPPGARQPLLVFGDDERAMGLMVDEILDVMEERLVMDHAGERPGYLGSCVLNGKVTEILDTAYWLRQGRTDWFGAGDPSVTAGTRLLLVEDSAFFKNLAVPALTSAGFEVVTVSNGKDALRLREVGERFDVIVSDINMPHLDGLGLAQAVREGGIWSHLPMIALSSQSRPEDLERGRAAGFSDYVVKFDREALLTSLRHCTHPGLAQ
jgi:two-component system chemotaxis sensor kinase CheA